MANTDIIIIGSGLAGLTTAYLLEKEGITSTILEARQRLGGRIFTQHRNEEPPVELGATWLGKKHDNLVALLEELDIGIFEQQMGSKAFFEPISTSPPQLVQLPENEEPTYRIEGGTDAVIRELSNRLSNSQILTGQRVQSIRQDDRKIVIETQQEQFKSNHLISTLPPNLLVKTVSFSPKLPAGLLKIARKTHTWMAESIKVGLVYKRPFWLDKNTSGTIMSNVGPLTELYDHSSSDGDEYALTGFMNGAYHQLSRKERESMVITQLKKFYGAKAENHIRYIDQPWKSESLTFETYDEEIIPHQHNGHSVYQKAYWNDRLYLAGSETASSFPGYMDGAVESARRVVEQIV